jgi:hypothetical protein
MNPSQQSPATERQVPFPGHPFGGLTREDGLKLIAAFEALLSADDDADAEEGAGFDFHLGVYSKF